MTGCPTCADTLTGELCRVTKRCHKGRLSPLIFHMSQPRPPTLVLVRDLIFASRITATARAIGSDVKLLRDPAMLGGESGRRLIVDLNQGGALEAAIEWKGHGGEDREVIGFVAHVDAETIRRARDAGIDRVLPRSRFVEDLESLLRGDGD